MNISLQSHIPDSTFLFIFLTKENRQATEDALSFISPSFLIAEEFCEKGEKKVIPIQGRLLCFLGLGSSPSLEAIRQATHKVVGMANEYKLPETSLLFANQLTPAAAIAIAESAILSNYQFLVYKSLKKANALTALSLIGEGSEIEHALEYAKIVAESTLISRNLVNEPVITLTAEELARRTELLGKECGFDVEVLNMAKIESLKMGGLIAVNMGSQLPPTFTILEYKPAKPINTNPIILVGKGVVYDTGGLSLKPTPNSMDYMKCDMAGAAAVIGAICGVAKLKLDCHVIGLVPATDNRPGENAYVPGDVITMYDGTSVEVLNTDAEGRLILGDALAYAKQYAPELVIDLATLTGACVVAIGGVGLALMSNASEEIKQAIKTSGENVYERLIEFPLWDEYGEMLKSDIADLKNIGGSGAGAITAGKFLQHFTDYPWIHLDIAGAAWNHTADSYRGKNGTGTGVRLLIDFLYQRCKKE